jgi:hypothetical protein
MGPTGSRAAYTLRPGSSMMHENRRKQEGHFFSSMSAPSLLISGWIFQRAGRATMGASPPAEHGRPLHRWCRWPLGRGRSDGTADCRPSRLVPGPQSRDGKLAAGCSDQTSDAALPLGRCQDSRAARLYCWRHGRGLAGAQPNVRRYGIL